MNLFEISTEYQLVLNDLFDPETGEIIETSMQELNKLIKDLKAKGITIASFIKNMYAELIAIEDATKNMTDRKIQLSNKIDLLTDYLKSNMEKCDIQEISCPYFAIKVKQCPASVDIQNEELIPKAYIKIKEVITTSIDKVKIREDIKAGIAVPGAEVKQNTRLEIK